MGTLGIGGWVEGNGWFGDRRMSRGRWGQLGWRMGRGKWGRLGWVDGDACFWDWRMDRGRWGRLGWADG